MGCELRRQRQDIVHGGNADIRSGFLITVHQSGADCGSQERRHCVADLAVLRGEIAFEPPFRREGLDRSAFTRAETPQPPRRVSHPVLLRAGRDCPGRQ